ncbi:lipid A deacylase LpxR family protein [Labilibacter sediminis]|nr:lipid A deacylase LpxR family protein [Labilibacter sediminis]
MMRQFSIVLLFLFQISIVAQQTNGLLNYKDFTSYKLIWENDVMFQTDYYYTQGLAMELIHSHFQKNPVNHLFFFNKFNTNKQVYGISLHQQMFTPLDIKKENILYGDRPYAGLLYLKSFSKSANTEKKYLIKSELDIGLIGPSSLADITQYKFHEISDNHLPNGWINQIKQVPIINYNVSYYKGIYETNSSTFMAYGRGRIGSLYDDIQLGIEYRFGYLNSFFETIGEDTYLKSNKWQAYLTLSPNLTFVGYNATLQGNVFKKNHQTYIIRPDDIERVVYGFDGSASIIFKGVGISYQLNFQSPEFRDGLHHLFHSTSFIFRF